MTREECKAKLTAIEKVSTSENLRSAVIFFKTPITKDVEARSIYSDNVSECIIWLDRLAADLSRTQQAFACYLDCTLYKSEGSLF